MCILMYMVWLHQTIQNLTKPETWNVENEGWAYKAASLIAATINTCTGNRHHQLLTPGDD